MAQERLHLRTTHFNRVTFVVVQHKAPNPVDISFLRAIAVVAKANGFAHVVEEARGLQHGEEDLAR
jgi:hypothetical protein